jgi:tRNA G18 (ribose-2'-O)-methylase SpoU
VRRVAVDDPRDERLAGYQCLTDAELRRRYEEGAGVFIAEGVTVIRHLLRAGRTPLSVLVTPAKFETLEADLASAGVAVNVPVYVAGQAVMNTVAGFDIHRGALALMTRPNGSPSASVLGGTTRVAMLERINDQENMGSLFRNAAAFGLGGFLLCPECCDPLYRRCVRVSMGHVLTVPWARMPSLEAGLDAARAAGFLIAALTPRPDAVAINDLNPCDPALAKVLLLLGAEGPGLSPAALGAADQRWRIPMAPGVDSLNVATAAAVAFHRLASPD